MSRPKGKRPTRARAPKKSGPVPAPTRTRTGFLPETLDRTVIAVPLLRQLETAKPDERFDVVIDLNLDFEDGREAARKRVEELLAQVEDERRTPAPETASLESAQYVFASLDAEEIRALVRSDTKAGHGGGRAINHIWPDFPLKRFTNKSISTVKADALHNAFAALGDEIVWAVVDSGIDGTHRHFVMHDNLTLPAPLKHRDFTARPEAPLIDEYGHGTHVAGIIAGQVARGPILAITRQRDERGVPVDVTTELESISGMAPRATLLSLKVLDVDGAGKTSSVIAALEYVQKLNGYGRRIIVHGVNLSVGYDFEPEWFACGQSPLCVEVNRLVKSGVVVVVAAGNAGYGFVESIDSPRVSAGLDLTINDPGNAEFALTIGSTHRDMPHVYGVSYFSSKGPTGDGRLKPDLLAPGEKIISCDSSQREGGGRTRGGRKRVPARYREDSGTSMAAPHVSGVIAAFLSVRREFIGQPEEVKRVFLATATDLKRDRYFQGQGLIDAMRAIQSV